MPTALVFVFDCLLFFTIVPFMMGMGGREKLKFWQTARTVILNVVTHPFNIATAVLSWRPGSAGTPRGDRRAGRLPVAGGAPCALFALGVTVALRPYEGVPKELPVHLAIKLILHPLLVWVVLSAVGDFDRAWSLRRC